MNRSSITLALAACLFMAWPGVAHADKEASVKLYKQGKKKFNLGEFEPAIELFKQAYDEFEAPAYLYNIAQAYRQLGDCKKALFFYERFLAEKPDSGQADTIRGYMAELKESCQTSSTSDTTAASSNDGDDHGNDQISDGGTTSETTSDSASSTALDGTSSNQDTASPSAGTEGSTTGISGSSTPAGPRAPLVSLTAEAGPAFFNMGDVIVPVSATLRVGAAYPLELGALRVEPGVSVLLSTMAYEEASGDSSVLFSTYLVNVSASYEMSKTLRVGGELGVGFLSYSGLAQGNPFTVGGMEQADSFKTASVRLGATAEYALAPKGLSVSASPGLSYAGADDGLADRISSVSNIQILGGVRYRW